MNLTSPKNRKAKSIAVLPFVNMSTDQENEYFCDGMTEEIINALSKIEGLKVTSRTSSFYFKNKNIPVPQIGKTLGVSTVLEGSIRLSGKKMRITAQLIDVTADYHFWSETFDRTIDDIFVVQDEVSLLIADKLRENIGHLEFDDQLVVDQGVPADIYRQYLESRYYILKMTKGDIEFGIQILEGVLRKAPDFALGHIGMNLGYTMLGTIGLMPAGEAFMKAKPHLDRAIELDENLPECQLNLSYIAFLGHWDMASAYQYMQRSYELRPTVEYYQSMASVLVAERKFDAALNYINTALQIDPFSGINYHLKGYILYGQEEYKPAIQCFTKALELSPGFMASTLNKGQALLLDGQLDEGLHYFQSLPADQGQDVLKLGGTTLSYILKQDIPNAMKGIEVLEKEMKTELTERVLNLLILCYTNIGMKEKTLLLIEKAFDLRLPMLVYYYTEPFLKSLRNDATFKALMSKVYPESPQVDLGKRKYKKVLLDESTLLEYKAQLEQLMTTEKPYLNPDLTLRSLAQVMAIHPNNLSRVLNEGFNKNFAEYVNSYRLEAFKTKLAEPKNKQLTILAIAYDSGFNSKTVFNTFFKKMMGKTPKAYWKEVSDKTQN